MNGDNHKLSLVESYWEVTSGARVALFLTFYRTSRNFWIASLLPVMLVVFMSLSVNALHVHEIEARLNIIMTLWLTLYAHKYVASQQMEKSDENTVMDYIIILGYFGLISQAVIVSLAGNDVMSVNTNYLCQGVVVGVLLSVTMLYGVKAQRHQNRVSALESDNSYYIPEWLFKLLDKKLKDKINDKELKRQNKPVVAYHNLIKAVTGDENEVQKFVFENAHKIKHLIPRVNSKEDKSLWPILIQPEHTKGVAKKLSEHLGKKFQDWFGEGLGFSEGDGISSVPSPPEVSVKNWTDCLIKREVRGYLVEGKSVEGKSSCNFKGLIVNDQFRFVYKYKKENQTDQRQWQNFIKVLFENADIYEIDPNFTDATRPQLLTITIGVDESVVRDQIVNSKRAPLPAGYKIPVEIMVVCDKSYANLLKMAPRYRVERLRAVLPQEQEILKKHLNRGKLEGHLSEWGSSSK